MDPDATLRELLNALLVGDVEQVTMLSDALHAHVDSGDYPPKTVGKWKLGLDWHAALTRSICNLARTHVHVICARTEGVHDVPR